VIDEYGGTAGLVTFDSLMERIVGAVGGGPGGGERITIQADGSADINGLALAADVNEQFELGIDENVYTTVGGYVLGRLGRREPRLRGPRPALKRGSPALSLRPLDSRG